MDSKPYILNIESSTEVCSISISYGTQTAALRESSEPYEHSKVMTCLIAQCCEDAEIALNELSAVALSTGPGSYTSLRVGTSVAKGLCFSLNLPLMGVDTLRSLAYATFLQEQDSDALYCPMLDARRMEVYHSLFNSKGQIMVPTSPKIIDSSAFDEYFSHNKKIIFSGPGSNKTKEFLTSNYAFFSPIACSALHLQAFSYKYFLEKKFENLAYFVPTYLKAPNITGLAHSKALQDETAKR